MQRAGIARRNAVAARLFPIVDGDIGPAETNGILLDRWSVRQVGDEVGASCNLTLSVGIYSRIVVALGGISSP